MPMCSDIAISVKNLTKTYRIFGHPADRIKQALTFGRVRFHREFTALQDISFEIRKGESVGIIGRNGSGKSTLLQLICGILKPTSGEVQVNGRIAALLELGSGFNPEFTGRENVYFQGAVMGISKEEMERRFDDVATFADIGEFMDQPVRIYSSGMYVRLAFAVNILSDPEIMVVDEALAVGDMAFQAKCMTALTRIQDRGATVLFVSHDISALRSLCSRGVYLEHGIVQAIGKAPDVAEQYIRTMREEMNAEHRKFIRTAPEFTVENKEAKEGVAQLPDKNNAALKRSDEFDKRVAVFRYGTGGAKISYAELLNINDEPIHSVEFNQEIKFRIYVEAFLEQDITVNFYILDEKKINLTGCGFPQAEHELLHTNIGGIYLIEYVLRLPLQEGSYALRLQITSPLANDATVEYLDVIEDAVTFKMERWKVARTWAKIHLFPTLNLKRLADHVN